jgi:hypothetical protein
VTSKKEEGIKLFLFILSLLTSFVIAYAVIRFFGDDPEEFNIKSNVGAD